MKKTENSKTLNRFSKLETLQLNPPLYFPVARGEYR
uniref:Uncharacterized protein n=1 Tax=Picea sitchensis TaxID=3332 RepID=A9NM13_PICSI|nr:unknown [Picea sitchensis]